MSNRRQIRTHPDSERFVAVLIDVDGEREILPRLFADRTIAESYALKATEWRQSLCDVLLVTVTIPDNGEPVSDEAREAFGDKRREPLNAEESRG